MAGSGATLITNGSIAGTNHAWCFTSDDGKSWQGEDLYQPDGKGFGALYNGGWLRSGLEKDARPVWCMVGGSNRGMSTSCAGSSTNGKTFGDRVVFDERHVCDQFYRSGDAEVTTKSLFSFPDWHQD